MIRTVAAKYALRSLMRNPRRTILSVVGVAVGCTIGLFAKAWYSGATDWQIRAASESGVGHLLVVNERWREVRENTLRVRDWRKAMETARAEPGVVSVAPRIKASGLLALGNKTAAVEIAGVNPDAERASNRTVGRARIEGRYLEVDGASEVVIGRGLAATLGAELDDQLVVTLSGKDEVQSAMLTVVGILDAGIDSLNDVICHANLGDIERLSGREGVGEIGIMLEDHDRIDLVQTSLTTKLPEGSALITWGEVMTAFSMNIESDTAAFSFMIFVIMLVVGLFIMSAQLSAVLERRKEFAVLSALGMKGRRVVSIVLIEGFLTGVIGACLASLLGGGLAYWLSLGVDVRALFGDSFDSLGVLMDPIVYGDFGIWIIRYSLTVCVIATVVASLVPAWKATKVDPAEALRMV
jgi:ABC-type lipoprotein release transport system permease subunit